MILESLESEVNKQLAQNLVKKYDTQGAPSYGK